MNSININLIHKDARIPTKRKGDAGYDIYSPVDTILNSGEIKLIPSGFKIEIPEGYVGLLKGRSGLGLNGIDPLEFYDPETFHRGMESLKVLGGVIDSSYRGEIGIILKNLGGVSKHIGIGDKICQIIIIPIWEGEMVKVRDLSKTERGEKGFGSTDSKIPEALKAEPKSEAKVYFDPSKYLK